MSVLIANVFKLNLLFSIELLVLLAAMALFAYLIKIGANKWLRYGACVISVVMVGIIICTAINAFCGCGYGCEGKCKKGGESYHHKKWDKKKGHKCPHYKKHKKHKKGKKHEHPKKKEGEKKKHEHPKSEHPTGKEDTVKEQSQE